MTTNYDNRFLSYGGNRTQQQTTAHDKAYTVTGRPSADGTVYNDSRRVWDANGGGGGRVSAET